MQALVRRSTSSVGKQWQGHQPLVVTVPFLVMAAGMAGNKDLHISYFPIVGPAVTLLTLNRMQPFAAGIISRGLWAGLATTGMSRPSARH